MTSLGEAFIAALPAELRSSHEYRADLDDALAHALEASVARWGSWIEPQAFAAYLAARVTDAGTAETFAHASELYLACAIAGGHPLALAAFEREHMSAVGAHVARMKLSEDELDELKQRLRGTFLVAEGGQLPRIVDYSGRGALGAWLRVAAVRMALRQRRDEERGAGGDGEGLERIASDDDSPEVRYALAEHGAAFRAALRASIAALDAEEQNLLRQHHLDELTLDQLAALYGVHRTTVAYRVGRARERLWKLTRERLVEAHRLTDSACESLFGHARSHLAATFRGLFD